MSRSRRVALATASFLGARVKSVPGIAGAACGVVGVLTLFGGGWALIAACGFLLAIDRSIA